MMLNALRFTGGKPLLLDLRSADDQKVEVAIVLLVRDRTSVEVSRRFAVERQLDAERKLSEQCVREHRKGEPNNSCCRLNLTPM